MSSPAYTCLICDAEFISLYALQVHTSRMHKGVDKSEIPNQYGMYESTKPMLSPIPLPDTSSTTVSDVAALNTTNGTYVCKFCPKTFVGKLDRFLHIVKIHKCSQSPKLQPIPVPTFVCTECRREFMSPQSLRVHISHMHVVEIEPPNEKGRYTCKYCDRDFKSTRSRSIHFGRIHGIGRRRLPKTEKEASFHSRDDDRVLKPSNGLHVTVDKEVTSSAKVIRLKASKNVDSSCEAAGNEISPPSSVGDEDKNEEEEEVSTSSSVQDEGKNEEENEVPPPSSTQDEDKSKSTSDADTNDESTSSTSTSDDAAMVCAEKLSSTNAENVDQAQSVSQRDEIEKNEDQPPKSTSSHPNLLQGNPSFDSEIVSTNQKEQPEPEKLYKCPLCDKSFQVIYSRNAHMKSHYAKGSAQKVGASPKPRTSPTTRNTVAVAVEQPQPAKSEDTGATLNEDVVDQSSPSEVVGKESEEPAVVPEQLLHQCWYCDRSFPSSLSRAAHTKVHYADGSLRKVYPTPKSSPTYVVRRTRPSSKQIKRHKSVSDISSWTRSKTFRCLLCPKILLTQAALISHVKTHKIVHEPSPKTLQSAAEPSSPPASPDNSTPAELMNFRTSLQVRLYRLPITPMNDKRKQKIRNANVDVVRNEPEVWFCCEICDRKFTTHRGYARHLWYCKAKGSNREEHKETAEVSTDPVVVELNDEEEFVCDTCDLAFARRKDLSEHVLGHVSPDPLLLEDSLANGERTATATSNDSISCPLCDRQFVAQKNLNTHMFKKHHLRKGPNGYSLEKKSSPAKSGSVKKTRGRTLSPVNGAIDQEENESMDDFEGWATKRPRQSLLVCKGALKQYYAQQSQSEVEQQCHLCGLCFPSAVALKKHVETECGVSGTSKNDGDDKVVQNGEIIKEELTGNKSALGECFDDSNNGEEFHDEQKMEVENIADVGAFSCCCCFKKFACESDVRMHENQPETLLFCCGICNLYFINTDKAKQHSKIHTLSN